MTEDKIKVSLLIPKEIMKKVDEGKMKEFLFTRTLYINQILRLYFGFPSSFDEKTISVKRKNPFDKRKK